MAARTITVILAVSLSTSAKAQYQLPPTVERHRYSYSPAEESYQPQYDPYQERRETFGARSSSTINFGQRKIAVQVQHHPPETYVEPEVRQSYRVRSSPARRLADGFQQNYQLHSGIPAQNNVIPSEIRQPDFNLQNDAYGARQNVPPVNNLQNDAYGTRQNVPPVNPFTITNPINGQKFPVEQPVWRQNSYDVNVDYRGQVAPTYTTTAPPHHNFQYHNNFLPQNSFLSQFGRPNTQGHNGFIISNGAVYRDPSINFQNPFNTNPGFNLQTPQQYQSYEFQDSTRPRYEAASIFTRPASNEIQIDHTLSDKVIKQVAPPPPGVISFESTKFTKTQEPVQNWTVIAPPELNIRQQIETTTAPSTAPPLIISTDTSAVENANPSTVSTQQPTSPDSVTRNQYYNNLVNVPDYSSLYQGQTETTRQPSNSVPHNFNLYFQPTPVFDTSSSVASVDQRLQQPGDIFLPTTSRPQQQSEFVYYQSTPATPSNNYQGLLPGQVNDGFYSNGNVAEFNAVEDKDQKKETLFSVNGFEEDEPETTSTIPPFINTSQDQTTSTITPFISTSQDQTTIGHHQTKTEISEITITELPQTTTSPVTHIQNSFLDQTNTDHTSSRNDFLPTSIPLSRGRERVIPNIENSFTRKTSSDRPTIKNDFSIQSNRGSERVLPTDENSYIKNTRPDHTTNRNSLASTTRLISRGRERFLPVDLISSKPSTDRKPILAPSTELYNRGRERVIPADGSPFSRKSSTDRAQANRIGSVATTDSINRSRVSPTVGTTQVTIDGQYSRTTISTSSQTDENTSLETKTESGFGQTFDFNFEASSTTPGTSQTEENSITEAPQRVDQHQTELRAPGYNRELAQRRKNIRFQNKSIKDDTQQERQTTTDEEVKKNSGDYRGRRIRPNNQNWAMPEVKQRVITRGRFHATIPQRNNIHNHRTTTYTSSDEATSRPEADASNDEETSSRPHLSQSTQRGQSRFPQTEPTTSTNQGESGKTSTVSVSHLPHLRYQIRQKVRPTEPQRPEETTTQAGHDSETTEQTHFTTLVQSNANQESAEDEDDHQTESEQTGRPERVYTSTRSRLRGPSFQRTHAEKVRKEERPVFSLKKHSFNGRLRVPNPAPEEDQEKPLERKQVRYNQYPQRQMIIKRIKVKPYSRQNPSDNQDQDVSGSVRTGYRRNQETSDKSITPSIIRNSIRFPPRKPFSRFSTTTQQVQEEITEPTHDLQTKSMTSESVDGVTTEIIAHDTDNTTTERIPAYYESTTSRVTEKRQIDDEDLKDLVEDSQTLQKENKNTEKLDELITLSEEKEYYLPNNEPVKPDSIEMEEEHVAHSLPQDSESSAITSAVEYPVETEVFPSILPEIVPSQNPSDIVTRIDVVTSISEDDGRGRRYEETADLAEMDEFIP